MTKPHLNSRTLWVNAVTLFVAVLLAFGVDLKIDGEQQAAIVTVIITVVNLLLRLDTEHKLDSSTDDNDPMQGDLSETKRE